MSGFSAIDLTKLSAPDIVESLDFESILSEMIVDLQMRDPAFTALLESDPAIKILEVAAYREVLLRARINDASRAVMLAYATGNDLEHLAAFFGVMRQVVDPGDADSIPPIPATYESDDRLRKRTQLSLEGHSTAGPVGSYIFHAIAASSLVKDVDVASPSPGRVVVTLLSTDNEGIPSDELIGIVADKLSDKAVRPLTDEVTVQRAEIITYTISADLILYEGPDSEVVRQTALNQVTQYVQQHHLLGNDITLSGLYATLHQEGVQRVILQDPSTDIVVASHQAAWCESVTVIVSGRDE
jgi:phage-related baseplate assembly protein